MVAHMGCHQTDKRTADEHSSSPQLWASPRRGGLWPAAVVQDLTRCVNLRYGTTAGQRVLRTQRSPRRLRGRALRAPTVALQIPLLVLIVNCLHLVIPNVPNPSFRTSSTRHSERTCGILPPSNSDGASAAPTVIPPRPDCPLSTVNCEL